jgi:hypothetical protein
MNEDILKGTWLEIKGSRCNARLAEGGFPYLYLNDINYCGILNLISAINSSQSHICSDPLQYIR